MAVRTYGLSGSGIDVDQMVKDMMTARRASFDKVWQKKTQLEWKKADYNSMYTTFQEFRNTTAFNYRLQSTTVTKSVSSSAENTVTAKANADAVNVSHSINVTQLAEGAKLSSSNSISVSTNKESLRTQFGLDGTIPSSLELVLSDGETSKAFKLDTRKSIYEFISDINKSGLNIKASYDANADRFFLNTTQSGSEVGIDFTGTTEETFTFLKDALKLGIDQSTPAVMGKDALLTLDGASFSQKSNTFTISGVTYNIKAEGSANIVVAPDNEKAVSIVKDFVNSYNSLIVKINSEMNEPKYSDYTPLTDQQKSELSDAEVTQWEKMAKSGMLRRDTILQNTVYKLRNDIANPIQGLTGKYNSLATIGVATGDYSEGGKLYVDEVKLKEALEADPDIINKLFGTTGEDTSAQGVAVRFYETLKESLDSIKTVAGTTDSIDVDTESSLALRIRDYKDSLDRMNDRLNQIEERYYRQFDAMESALNSLNQQNSWLLSQFNNQ